MPDALPPPPGWPCTWVCTCATRQHLVSRFKKVEPRSHALAQPGLHGKNRVRALDQPLSLLVGAAPTSPLDVFRVCWKCVYAHVWIARCQCLLTAQLGWLNRVSASSLGKLSNIHPSTLSSRRALS